MLIMVWLDVVQHQQLEDRVDAKHRVVASNRFKGGDRRIVRDRKVLTAACGNLAPGFEDCRALLNWDLRQQNRL